MMLPYGTQDVTSIDYEVPTTPSESSQNTLVVVPLPDVGLKIEEKKRSCIVSKKDLFFQLFLAPDIASIEIPILEPKIETALTDTKAMYENALVDDLLNRSYIIKMPPVKSRTIRFRVKKIKKPGPYV